MKILLIEDEQSEIDIFQKIVKIWNKQNLQQKITCEQAKDLSEAESKLDNSFDGAIVDIKLGNDKNAGNQITKKIHETLMRIPIVVYTGFPEFVNRKNPAILAVITRAEKTYKYALEILADVYNTGITRILGGRGEIEKLLHKVFIQSLLPQKATWIAHGKTHPDETEKALLRYTINHLIQQLDEDCKEYFPEEFYLSSLRDEIQTGSIVQEKGTATTNYFVILTPACDLYPRKNGKPKTDVYLLVKIGDLKKDCRRALYYYELPKDGIFLGEALNFRHLRTIEKENFDEGFEKLKVQISPPFIKNIIARFSSYYARQGEPEIRKIPAVKKD